MDLYIVEAGENVLGECSCGLLKEPVHSSQPFTTLFHNIFHKKLSIDRPCGLVGNGYGNPSFLLSEWRGFIIVTRTGVSIHGDLAS